MSRCNRAVDDIDRAIVRYVAEHQPSTVREIAAAVELGACATHGRIVALCERGVLRHEPRIPRTIRLHPSVVVTDRGVYQLEKMP